MQTRSSLACCIVVLAVWAGQVATGQEAEPRIFEGHTNVVSAVRFTSDSQRLISGSWDKTVRVWSIESGQTTQTLSGHEDWVFDVALAKDGSLLSATQNTIRRWRDPWERAETIADLGGAKVSAVSFSADGQFLATGGRDGKVQLWKIGEAAPRAVFEGFASWLSQVAISTDHKTLAAATRGGRIQLVDLTRRQLAAQLAPPSGQQILALALQPNGEVLATGGIDTTVRLWDLATAQDAGQLSGHRGVITAIAWSADGRRIATGERHGPIKVWSYAGGNQLLTTLPGHSDQRLGFTVTTLAFSPDGTRLASGSYDQQIKLWKLPEE